MGGKLHAATREMRFWEKVNKNGTVPDFRPELGNCWLWTGWRNENGYGLMRDGGKLFVHRYSYELQVGPIPERLHIDHLCRVTSCVRPSHLDPVTNQENMRRGLKGVLRTHCIRGHELAGANVRLYKGSRKCRACQRQYPRRAVA